MRVATVNRKIASISPSGPFGRIKGANTQQLVEDTVPPATAIRCVGCSGVKFAAKSGESPKSDIKSLNKRVKTRYKQVAGQF